MHFVSLVSSWLGGSEPSTIKQYAAIQSANEAAAKLKYSADVIEEARKSKFDFFYYNPNADIRQFNIAPQNKHVIEDVIIAAEVAKSNLPSASDAPSIPDFPLISKEEATLTMICKELYNLENEFGTSALNSAMEIFPLKNLTPEKLFTLRSLLEYRRDMNPIHRATIENLGLKDITAAHRPLPNNHFVMAALGARLALNAFERQLKQQESGNKDVRVISPADKIRLAQALSDMGKGDLKCALIESEKICDALQDPKLSDSRRVDLKNNLKTLQNALIQYINKKGDFLENRLELAKPISEKMKEYKEIPDKKELYAFFFGIFQSKIEQHDLKPVESFFQEYFVYPEGDDWVILHIPFEKGETTEQHEKVVQELAERVRYFPKDGTLLRYELIYDRNGKQRGSIFGANGLEIFTENKKSVIEQYKIRNGNRMRIDKKRSASLCPPELTYTMVRENRDLQPSPKEKFGGAYHERQKRTVAVDRLEAVLTLRDLMNRVMKGDSISPVDLTDFRTYFLGVQTNDLAVLPGSIFSDPVFNEATEQFQSLDRLIREGNAIELEEHQGLHPANRASPREVSVHGDEPIKDLSTLMTLLNKIGSIAVKFREWDQDIEKFIEASEGTEPKNEQLGKYLKWYIDQLKVIGPVVKELAEIFPKLSPEILKQLRSKEAEEIRAKILTILGALVSPSISQLAAIIPLHAAVAEMSNERDRMALIRAIAPELLFNTAIGNIYGLNNHIQECLLEFEKILKGKDGDLAAQAQKARLKNKEMIDKINEFHRKQSVLPKSRHEDIYFPNGRKLPE